MRGAGKTDEPEVSVKMKSKVGEGRWGKRAEFKSGLLPVNSRLPFTLSY